MRFATYIFDAKSHQVLALTSFLHFARPVPSEMKITKIRWMVVSGRPGGMRGGAGGDMRGSEICKFEFDDMDFCFGFDTPCLGFRPRAADLTQRPCAFRRAAPKRPWSWFLWFSFPSALAERNAKNLGTLDLDATLHQKCKLQNAFCMHLCITSLIFPMVCKNVLPAFGGKHNSEKRLRIPSIKNLTFLTPKRLENYQLL